MTEGELTSAPIASVTTAVDIDAPPPETEPSALVLFGTYQIAPAVQIAARRYQRGLAPLIIATGGVNRHTGVVEAHEFARELAGAGVPASAVRVEDPNSRPQRRTVPGRRWLRR
jgi:hypothetical protein